MWQRRRRRQGGYRVTKFQASPVVVFLLSTSSCFSLVAAPFPPCSPFIFINKMVEANNWTSDMNPFYPVRPCPYRDPRRSPPALRFAVANHPLDNLYHVLTESKWFLSKGLPRAARMLLGKERFLWDPRILDEGYHSHYTGRERQQQFGRRTRKSKAYY